MRCSVCDWMSKRKPPVLSAIIMRSVQRIQTTEYYIHTGLYKEEFSSLRNFQGTLDDGDVATFLSLIKGSAFGNAAVLRLHIIWMYMLCGKSTRRSPNYKHSDLHVPARGAGLLVSSLRSPRWQKPTRRIRCQGKGTNIFPSRQYH